MELIAKGPEPEQRWRRRIPDGQVIRLGRRTRSGWDVPWDLHISREHAEIALVGDQLKVRRLEVARNYISYLGGASNEFTMSAGEKFQIGVTSFYLFDEEVVSADTAGSAPASVGLSQLTAKSVHLPAADTPWIELNASSAELSDRLGSILDIRCRPRLESRSTSLSAAFAADSHHLAIDNGSNITIYDMNSGEATCTISMQVPKDSVAKTLFCLSSDGERLFTALDAVLSCWDAGTGAKLWQEEFRRDFLPLADTHWTAIKSLASYSPDKKLVVGVFNGQIRLLDDRGKLFEIIDSRDDIDSRDPEPISHLAVSKDGSSVCALKQNGIFHIPLTAGGARGSFSIEDSLTTSCWSEDGNSVAVGTSEGTVEIHDADSGDLMRKLEGHTGPVASISFWDEGRYLVSTSDDGTARLWDCDAWENLAVFSAPESGNQAQAKIWAHPCQPVLMTIGEPNSELVVWEFDIDAYLDVDAESATSHYTNAKVVFVGDSGVGKSALCHRLANREWEPTDGSTHGMKVLQFESAAEQEIMLWDFAGQSEYRLVHQLFLTQTTIALLLYDPTKSDDSFFGVEYWERALNNSVGGSHRKILVAARTDVGGVRMVQDDVESYCSEHNYLAHYSTSARSGDGCQELGAAIQDAIPWDELPQTSSPRVFKQIKQFLIDVRESQRSLVRERELLREFASHEQHDSCSPEEFETVVGHIENAGIIKRLSFGGLILLRPEMLNGLASDIIDAARSHEFGLGAVSRQDVLNGNIAIRDRQELDRDDDIYLLHATVELFLGLGLALEQDGNLVFPSKFNRRMPALVDDPIIQFRFSFSGPIDNIYTTLVVKLYYSGVFALKRLWKNAAEFHNGLQQICGIQLQADDSGQGVLRIFFSKDVPANDRALFLKFVADHFSDRNVEANRERLYQCPACGEKVRDHNAIERAIQSDIVEIPCLYCFNQVPLIDSIELLYTDDEELRKHVQRMDQGAHSLMNRRSSLVAAQAEMRCSSFQSWAGGCRHANMAIVFTDIIDSTRLNREIGDLDWSKVRKLHFERAEDTVRSYDGFLIKNLGDGLLASFHNALDAVRFATELETEPGHEIVKIRAGVNVGPVEVDDNDVYGQHVNLTARIAAKAAAGGVLVSHRTKEELETFGVNHQWKWQALPDVSLKGFEQSHTLWALTVCSN